MCPPMPTHQETPDSPGFILIHPIEFHFGPYSANSAQRRLFSGPEPIRLGARATEVLFALLERAGELVSTSDLMKQVWPRSVVEEIALRVHIAALRASLRDRSPETCYVENHWGRGYRFAAPVKVVGVPASRRLPRR